MIVKNMHGEICTLAKWYINVILHLNIEIIIISI